MEVKPAELKLLALSLSLLEMALTVNIFQVLKFYIFVPRLANIIFLRNKK